MMPATSPRSLRNGTFVVATQSLPLFSARMYSSLSIIGRPVPMISRSSARYFCAVSHGHSSRSDLPISSFADARPSRSAVAWLAMTKRLSASLTHRLSVVMSISDCSEMRSSISSRLSRGVCHVLVGRDPSAVGH